MKTTLPLLFLTLLLFGACKKEDAPAAEPTPVTLNQFPLATGNKWTYHVLQSTIASKGNTYTSYDINWEVVSDTIIENINSFKVWQHTFMVNNDSANEQAYFYYANHDSGFYKIADYDVSSFAQFKNEPPQILSTGLIEIPIQPQAGPFHLLTPRPMLLKFPTSVNDKWVSYESADERIKRKWLGYETITTPAGTFDCIKLQVIIDIDLDGEQDTGAGIIYQYFSAKGLIRETLSYPVTVENGEVARFVKSADLMKVNF